MGKTSRQPSKGSDDLVLQGRPALLNADWCAAASKETTATGRGNDSGCWNVVLAAVHERHDCGFVLGVCVEDLQGDGSVNVL